MNGFTKSIVEDAVLAWPEALGYAVLHGPDTSPGDDTLTPTHSVRDRENYHDVPLDSQQRAAVGAEFARGHAGVAKNATTRLRGNIQEMHIGVSKKATVSIREIVRRWGCHCV